MLQDRGHVADGRGDVALGRQLQIFQPGRVDRILPVLLVEGSLDLVQGQLVGHVRIGQGEADHVLIRRAFIDRGVRRQVLVLQTELVDPDQIEGVHQLPADRVRPVVGEGEQALLIQDQAGLR